MSKFLPFIVFWLISLQAFAQIAKTITTDDTTYIFYDPEIELLDASSSGDTSKIKAFLKIGTDINTTTWEGVTPLMYAAQNGHLLAVEMLIDEGADINAKPYSQIDALMGATIAGHVHIADTLILNGADVNTRSLESLTPLMYAAAYDYKLLCDVLLFYAAKINAKDINENSAIHFATFYGNLEVLQLLVDNGANKEDKDENGFTPLIIASQNGHLPIVQYLLNLSCSIEKTNGRGHTALTLAVYNQQYEVAEYLLSMGANPNHHISEKVNLYELARLSSNKEITELLVVNGADPGKKYSIDKLNINYDLNWNSDDMMMGGSLGLIETKIGLELQGGYRTRPAVRSVLVETGPDTYYQFWEKRSLFFAGAAKRFVFFNPSAVEEWGVFAGLNGGYTYGSYRGSNTNPENTILFIPKGGIFGSYKLVNMKFNYEYMKIKGSEFSPHLFAFSIGVNINLKKSKIPLKKEPTL